MNTCPLLFCFSLLFVCCRPISLHLYVCRYRIFCYHKLVNKDLYKNRIRKIHCFFIGGLGPQPLPSGYALGINSLVPKVWRVEIILNRSHHREHAHLIRVVILDIIMCTQFDGSSFSRSREPEMRSAEPPKFKMGHTTMTMPLSAGMVCHPRLGLAIRST